MADISQLRTPDQPLVGLDTSKYTYANYIYPLDLGTPTAGKDHYVVFHINESSNTQFTTQTVNGKAPGDQATINVNANQDAGLNADGTAKSPANATGTSTQGTNGNSANQQTLGNQTRSIQRVATTIVLYMPPEIQTAYTADWGQTELGLAREGLELFKKNGKSLTDVFKSGGDSALASIMKGLGNTANNFTDLNLKDAISLGARMVINNHQEVIFNGIPFRQFNFNWRFTPESESEALNVDNIIRAFKFYSAPEILQGEAGRYWIYPAEFDIQYYSSGKENQFLNKISTCALTNMTVNYTAAGHWTAFRGHNSGTGSPSVCTDITLQFTELELMTKKRILEGY